MDSSDPQTTNSIRSPLSSIAYNSSMITASKRDVFLSTYCRQKFTFPGSMMHYIAKNPKNSKGYQKMVKSCKYFFVKNPILILSDLRYTQNGWKTYDNKTWKSIDIDRISCKLWITDKHEVVPTNDSNNYIASSIIAKIYQCDFKYLFLSNQFISLHELIFLCSSVEALHFSIVNVKNDDGTVVSFDKLIEQLPNVKKVIYTFADQPNNTSKKTFKKLWKTSYFLNYDEFYLYNIPEDFDLESFNTFLKKNKKTRVYLRFSKEISEEYKTRLEAFIDEMICSKNREYKPFIPFIAFSRN